MTYDATQTIDAFLSAAAAKQPTPGGGSITALVGALAASMGEMAINYSVGKKDLAEHQDALQRGLAKLHAARRMMLEMMIEDQVAYEALTAARKLPPTDPGREKQVADLVTKCIVIPQSIGSMALVVLRIANELADKSNRYLLSDLAVCAELAVATVRCAAYNVRVNLPDAGADTRAAAQSELRIQLGEATRLIQSVMPRIWSRLEHA